MKICCGTLAFHFSPYPTWWFLSFVTTSDTCCWWRIRSAVTTSSNGEYGAPSPPVQVANTELRHYQFKWRIRNSVTTACKLLLLRASGPRVEDPGPLSPPAPPKDDGCGARWSPGLPPAPRSEPAPVAGGVRTRCSAGCSPPPCTR